jgi:predicted membrane channel-forming protein YqfA (hemolysin III family)
MKRRLSKREMKNIEKQVKRSKKGKKNNAIYFLVYLILGLYLINVMIPLFQVPEFFMKIHNFLIFLGGILLLVSAVRFLNSRR